MPYKHANIIYSMNENGINSYQDGLVAAFTKEVAA
jgi:hypothetical protein